MKYQIYLQKDVSDIINTVAKHYNKKPATLIKEMLESNFRIALEQEKKLQNYSKLKELTSMDYTMS